MESAWSEHGVMVYEALYLGGASDRVRWHQGSVPAGAGRHEAEIRFASWSVTCSDWRSNSRTEVRRRARLFVTNFVGAFVRCWSLASRRTRVTISAGFVRPDVTRLGYGRKESERPSARLAHALHQRQSSLAARQLCVRHRSFQPDPGKGTRCVRMPQGIANRPTAKGRHRRRLF